MLGKHLNHSPIAAPPPGHRRMPIVRIGRGSAQLNNWDNYDTVDGRNPAPIDRWFIPLFIGFQPSKVVQDFLTIHSMVLL